jgi:hypothetical protein
VEGLADGDSEGEDDEHDGEADAPTQELLTPPASTTLVALGRAQARHGP